MQNNTARNLKTDILLIIPPFYSLNSPPVEPASMKTRLKDEGFSSEILYANLYFAREISSSLNSQLKSFFSLPQWIEFVFASDAFPESIARHKQFETRIAAVQTPIAASILELRKKTANYLTSMVKMIKEKNPKIIWIYSYLRQLTSALALSRCLKQHDSSLVVTIGGGNCRTPMGQALLDIAPSVDYIFSGEPEFAFADFCKQALRGRFPEKRIIECLPIRKLDLLPLPDYSDYFQQLFLNLIRSEGLSVETSRGCWWGKKSQCLFCGLHTRYREKSTNRIQQELTHLLKEYPSTSINFKDLIMPRKVPAKVIQTFNSSRQLSLFYELKPTTPKKELAILKAHGLHFCQAGIETLNERLLMLLKKGVSLIENIRFLRDCTQLKIGVLWNFLYGIPFETEHDYREMIHAIPLFYHLPPPEEVRPILIQRFSPLYRNLEKYGIANLRPLASYTDIFPEKADLENLSVFFEGDYTQGLDNPELKEEFFSIVQKWQTVYRNQKPSLTLKKLTPSQYELIDTRKTATIRKIINHKHYLLLKKLQNRLSPVRLNLFIKNLDANLERHQLVEWGCLYESKQHCISLVIESD